MSSPNNTQETQEAVTKKRQREHITSEETQKQYADQFKREEEYFGFPPIRFVDDVINAANDLAGDGLDDAESFLRDTLRQENPEDIAKGVDNVMHVMRNSIDHNFDKFELFVLKNILRIPEDLDISSLMKNNQQNDTNSQEVTEIDQKMKELTEQIREAQKEQQTLLDKIAEADMQQKVYNHNKQMIEQIQTIFEEENVSSIEGLISEVVDNGIELNDAMHKTIENLASHSHFQSSENDKDGTNDIVESVAQSRANHAESKRTPGLIPPTSENTSTVHQSRSLFARRRNSIRTLGNKDLDNLNNVL